MNELFLPSGTHKEEKTASSLLVAALCDENLIGYRIACLSLQPRPRVSLLVLSLACLTCFLASFFMASATVT